MTPPTFRRLPVACALALGLAAAGSAAAQTTADPAIERAALQELRSTTLALIDLLVEQGLLSRAKADELLSKARPAAAAAPAWGAPPAQAPKVVRVPYLPETARAQMKEEIKNEILGTARDEGWTDGRRLPGWLKNVAIDGDRQGRHGGQAQQGGGGKLHETSSHHRLPSIGGGKIPVRRQGTCAAAHQHSNLHLIFSISPL